MRPLLLLPLLSLIACEGGLTANLEVTGEIEGKPIDMTIALTSGGGAMGDGTLVEGSGVQLAMIGGQQAFTSISAKTCPIEPCPDTATLNLRTPPPLIYAGRWQLREASILALGHDLKPVAGVDLSNPRAPYELDFEEPEFSWRGDVVLTQTATVHSPEGAKTKVTGSVGLEYQCHMQSKYYRHCGEANKGDGQSNPTKRAYMENTCPASLVAPYEASPKWKGDTLLLDGFEVDCRETKGTQDGGKPAILCYSRRKGVEADGCTWTVHFVTDGWVHQFVIAGFANEGCAQKTCNTYR